jgi:CRISPR/Cas system-associated endoribonuclease Cas2
MVMPFMYTGVPQQLDSPAWLLAYDIADPVRLSRISRFARTIGIPLQRSIILLPLSRHEVKQIAEKLSEMIDEDEDDVRIYHLVPGTRIWHAGHPWMPDGIMVSTLPLSPTMNTLDIID